jgi:hypothetical protein
MFQVNDPETSYRFCLSFYVFSNLTVSWSEPIHKGEDRSLCPFGVGKAIFCDAIVSAQRLLSLYT